MPETLRVLLVDDDPEFADRVADHLAGTHGIAVESTDGSELDPGDGSGTDSDDRRGPDRVASNGVDCVVVGDPSTGSGPAPFERIREAAPGIPVVALADAGTPSVAEALDAGADDALPRPNDAAGYDALAARIRRAVRRRDADRQAERAEAGSRRLDRRAPVPTLVYTEAGIVFPNGPALEFFGVEGFGPLVGRAPAEAFDADELAGAFAGVVEDGEGFGPVEHRFVAADGRERVCRLSAAPATHDGEPAGRVLVEDLTDRRAARDRLARERRVAAAALAAFEGIAYVTDREGRLVRWNDRLAAVSGRSDGDLDGTPIAEVIDRPTDTGGPGGAPFEARLRTADGDDRPVSVRELPVADDEGRQVGRVGMGWLSGDRSAGSGAEDGVGRADERRLDRLRTVVDGAPVALFSFGGGGTVELAAGESLSALGIDPATAVGRSVLELVEDSELRSACRRAMAGEAAEVTVEAGDRAFEVRLAPVDGSREAVGTAIEVTERFERERELERYRTLVEAAGDAMYALDADGTVTMVNEAGTDLAGVDREELVGSHVTEYVRPEDFERGTEAIRRLLEGDASGVARFEIHGEDRRSAGTDPASGADPASAEDDPTSGDEEPTSGDGDPTSGNDDWIPEGEGTVYEDIVAVVTDDDGEFRGSVGVLRDVTDRERRERELRRKNERLEEFASVVAHDLRGPLSVAYTDLEAAIEGDDDRVRDALASLERMDELLADLLTLARQGESVDDTERVALGDLAREAWDDTDAGAGTLRVEDPGVVEADPSRVRELFENLFRNSVEHGSTGPQQGAGDSVEHGSTGPQQGAGDSVEHGSTGPQRGAGDSVEHGSTGPRLAAGDSVEHGVTPDPRGSGDDGDGPAREGVTVQVGPLPEGRGFYVADDGPGIPPEEREAVFEQGYTLDSGGTGFGLAIVEGIARAHGWSVSAVESAEGGARFEVEAPVDPGGNGERGAGATRGEPPGGNDE